MNTLKSALRDTFLETLRAFVTERPRHSQLVHSPLGSIEPAWVSREAQEMLSRVNDIRAETGRTAVDMTAVRTIEHWAAIHHTGDAYNKRYAGLLAELVTAEASSS